jgi:hypothetical protein
VVGGGDEAAHRDEIFHRLGQPGKQQRSVTRPPSWRIVSPNAASLLIRLLLASAG